MIEIINLDYAHSYAEPEKDRAILIWKKKVVMNFEQFQIVYNAILDYQKQSAVSYFISDVRDQGAMPPNYRKWFQEVVIPTAVKFGLKKTVIIFDGNVFKKYYLNHILDTGVKFGLPMKFVASMEEAEKWLKN